MKKYIHGFWRVEGMNFLALRRLYKFFGDFGKAWRADSGLLTRAGVTADLADKIVETREQIDLDKELELLSFAGIALIDEESDEYPVILKEIADPPFMLYRKGAPLGADFLGIAVVGTRLPTSYGIEMCSRISTPVCKEEIIVSGLAFGIDAVAHRVALKNGRPTVAVLASGLARVTPSSHAALAKNIVAGGGTLISEYPQYDGAYRYRFLERNRIISGLCRATIVIEAREQSGALITARHAFDQNREVFALIGDINRPQTKGCLKRIRDHMAEPILSVEWLCDELGIDMREGAAQSSDPDSQKLLSILSKRSLTLNELLKKTGLAVQAAQIAIGKLQVYGLIKLLPNGKWAAKETKRPQQ